MALSEGYYLTVHPTTQIMRILKAEAPNFIPTIHSSGTLPTTASVSSIVITDGGVNLVASVSSDRVGRYEIDKTTMLIGNYKEADLSSAPGSPNTPLFSVFKSNYFIVFFGASPGPRNTMTFKNTNSYYKSSNYNSGGSPVDMQVSSNVDHFALQFDTHVIENY